MISLSEREKSGPLFLFLSERIKGCSSFSPKDKERKLFNKIKRPK